jgi:hypothetical protein
MPLASLPTPLVYAARFSAAVGGDVWLKRDDLTGLALGGNKARKIEYLFGQAAGPGLVDTVVTVGAPQSNHARTVAAAARLAGWDCHLVLGGERPERPSGNLVLDVALEAELHFAGTDDWSELETTARELAATLEAAGKHTLMIPMGGSTPVGALGFVGAYLELLDQLDERGVSASSIIHATSTGGTQAGLDYAHRVLAEGPDVIGVGVAKTQTSHATSPHSPRASRRFWASSPASSHPPSWQAISAKPTHNRRRVASRRSCCSREPKRSLPIRCIAPRRFTPWWTSRRRPEARSSSGTPAAFPPYSPTPQASPIGNSEPRRPPRPPVATGRS